MTSASKRLLTETVITTTTLTPRIVNAVVHAAHGRGDRLEQLKIASDALTELLGKIQLVRLTLQHERRGEIEPEKV